MNNDFPEEEKEFDFDEETIYSTLRSKGFTSNCNFAFNKKYLVIGGKNANPLKYDMEKKEISEIGKKCSSQTDAVTAIAISQDSAFTATGYPDGTIILWNTETNSEGNPYKLIHKSTITNIAFISQQKRLIIADYSGLITLLSLVQSLSCELVLQTTIINMRKPILSFVSLKQEKKDSPALIAFSSIDIFSFITVDRKISVHISKKIDSSLLKDFDTPHFSSDIIEEKDGTKRALMCTNKTLTLYEITSGTKDEKEKKSSELLTMSDIDENNIVKCFFLSFDRFLVVLEFGKALVFDITGKVIHRMTNLPSDFEPSNIQKCGHSLIFFMDNAIFQTKIPV